MLLSILQDGCINEKAQFINLIKSNDIRFGTVLKVPPTIPQFRILYQHYIMINDVNENSFDYLHLKKNLFKKEAEVVHVPFDEIEKFININYGIYIHWNISYDLLDYTGIKNRIHSMMKKPIPYGLKKKFSFNCETFLCFLILGVRSQSYELAKFENRFGIIGSFCICFLDKVILITNFIGEIIYLMQTERKE